MKYGLNRRRVSSLEIKDKRNKDPKKGENKNETVGGMKCSQNEAKTEWEAMK